MAEHDEPKALGTRSEPAPPDLTKELTSADYMRVVNAHLLKGNYRDAYAILRQAVVLHPDDPFILSYYGSLQAVVDKKYRSGVDACERALVLLKKKALIGEDVLYPVFYLNLGRAYRAAGKRANAIDAFYMGLQYDHDNGAILKELQGMGMRGNPPVPFLARSNPINKYLGMILHRRRRKRAGKNG
jgi:tetratricopeptide (TPR) repeat protein